MGGRSGTRRATATVVMTLLATVVAACGAVVPAIPAPSDADPLAATPVSPPEPGTPTGSVRVAYPDEPASLIDIDRDDPAAHDLHALWGLPLFRTDASGQLMPGLVERWETVEDGGGWGVRLELAEGTWSDGEPVVPDDVVATVAALRETARAPELVALVAVEPTGERGVTLRFDRPYARWMDLLDGIGVLPAHVLTAGLDELAAALPVTGGPFRLEGRDPGRSLTFVAHPGSPLGAPASETVEVLVVPRFEAALGLLDAGETDVVLGYLAVNGAGRARALDGVSAEDVAGGTWVGLAWRPDAPGLPDAESRRDVRSAIDVGQLVEGLLGPAAAVLDVPLPNQPGAVIPRGGTATVPDLLLLMPRWQEALSFTARAVQRDLRERGGDVQLVSEPTPRFVGEGRVSGDVALRILRTGPRPSFTRWVGPEDASQAVALAADAASAPGSARDAALALVATEALIAPLYRPAVTHAWTTAVAGVTPSAWPGLGFTTASSWRRSGA